MLQYHQHIEAETKWQTFHKRHFQMHFLEWRSPWISIDISLKFVPKVQINNIPSLDLDDGLVLTRRQAIISTNNGKLTDIYASLGLNESRWCHMKTSHFTVHLTVCSKVYQALKNVYFHAAQVAELENLFHMYMVNIRIHVIQLLVCALEVSIVIPFPFWHSLWPFTVIELRISELILLNTLWWEAF